MIYGQDAPIAFPVADLYDSGMMQMYVNAVRDQYQQGLKDYETFMSKYGDFTSPFSKDVDRWNNEIMGPTMNLIDALYAQGIDPMRNAEARAMIQKAVRSVPYAEAAKMRQNAKAGEDYIKARGALAAKGLYNKDYNDFWLTEQGYKPFEEWSSEDGIWNVTSPVEYKSLFDATSPWFEKMQKHDLTKEQVLKAKYPYDPRYRYTGIPVEDLQEVTGQNIPGFLDSLEGRYYRKKTAERLAAAGIEPTDDAVNAALAEDIVTANHRVVVDPIAEEDRYALADYNAAIEDRQAARDHKWEMDKLRLQAELKGGDGSSSSSSTGGGTGTNTNGTIPQGVADELQDAQQLQYNDNARNFINDRDSKLYKEQTYLYNKLLDHDKKEAVEYGKAYRTYNDSSASKVDREKAKTILRKLNNKRDANFIAWKNKFLERNEIDPRYEWSQYATTEGRANNKFTPDTVLRKNARDIFVENNVITDITDQQRSILDSTLKLAKNGDNLVGKMDKDRDLQDITVAEMTGDRTYRYNSVNQKVRRAIRGKKFIIVPENRVDREYAAGEIKERHYNVVNDVATFTDPEVVSELNKIPEEQLNQYGIKKRTVTDSNNNAVEGYDIPISTKTGHGMGRAWQNTQSDKLVGGVTEASSLRSTRQAREIANQIKGE